MILDILARLFFPSRANCVGCDCGAGFAGEWLCDDCRKELARLWLGARATPEVKGIEGSAYAYYYAGPVKGMVRTMKYRGAHKLAEPMAADMARAYAALLPTGADCIVAVPMHPRRLHARGFNNAEKLARGVGERTGLEYLDALSRTRYTRQQARLSRAVRIDNMHGAFACDGRVKGRRVVLVDDVCTTGATATACVAALRQAGAKAVYLLCYARADGRK